MKDAVLVLENGSVYRGRALTVTGESAGEVVFNTAMTGYQEILTDPSYAGQIVTMTYPLIGNYGVNPEDVESERVHVKGFVAKEFCRRPSNRRATGGLIDYLEEHGIPAIEGIDTRALTRQLRVFGAMKGILSTEGTDPDTLAAKLESVPSMAGSDWVKEVTTGKVYVWPAADPTSPLFRVAALDCGIKRNILRILASLGCEIHVFPARSSVEDIRAIAPDGLFLSNGPGDPAAVPYVAETVRAFFDELPIFGICLGHQILALALGGRTYKLRFGHHGANHPVRDEATGRISITSQNHGFCVDYESLDPEDVALFQVNLNDGTVEGLRHRRMPLYSVQHHPEAAPGPREARYLFEDFIDMMRRHKGRG